jgi:hypothetical protein
MYTYAQTFNLKSGIFASAWSTNQPVYIYAWANDTQKGEIKVDLSQTPTTIGFAKYGSEFKNINLIEIRVAGKGEGGSTCTYGHETYGYQVAFDNLKITLNSPGANRGQQGHHFLLPHPSHHHVANPFAATWNIGVSGHAAPSGSSLHDTGGAAGTGYHSELTTLTGPGEHDHAGLTNQFALPQSEHFGL